MNYQSDAVDRVSNSLPLSYHSPLCHCHHTTWPFFAHPRSLIIAVTKQLSDPPLPLSPLPPMLLSPCCWSWSLGLPYPPSPPLLCCHLIIGLSPYLLTPIISLQVTLKSSPPFFVVTIWLSLALLYSPPPSFCR